jgi:hypothetical protein
VHAVAELVREREDVATPRRVVQQHVRVLARHGVGAERAAALAGAHGRVDEFAGEELPRGVAEVGGEVVVAREDELARVVPLHGLLVLAHGRHAVVVLQAVDPEQLRLQAVPAAGQLVAVADRLDERLHRLVARLVREVP